MSLAISLFRGFLAIIIMFSTCLVFMREKFNNRKAQNIY